MHEPFFTTEADEMSRAFDPTNADVPPAAPPATPSEGSANHRLNSDALRAVEGESAAIPTPVATASVPRRAVSSQAVCPFCGCINDSSAGACRQCGMENTQATRQATRSKIGPWFVWQARNPSAPGMNWATLMSLVEKGRITPRSVVRGPTTGQLWRFAARVKGLSREFGTCWHCGTELKKAARLCAGCKRLQQPPANPDMLLETPETAPFKPVINPRHQGLLSLVTDPVLREVPSPPETPRASTFPAPAPSGGDNSVNPPLDPSVPVIDMGDELLPIGMEMRTFRLDPDTDFRSSRKSVFTRILIAAVLTFIALAPVFYFNPQVRPHYIRWYQQLIGWVKGIGSHSIAPAAVLMESTETEVSRRSPTPLWSAPVPGSARIKPATIPEAVQIPQPGTTEIQVSPGNATHSPSVRTEEIKPLIQISPSPLEPQTAERRSWELYKRAIESEQREDYTAAVKAYEWIEQLRLPEGAGPTDVESRLQVVRQRLKQSNN